MTGVDCSPSDAFFRGTDLYTRAHKQVYQCMGCGSSSSRDAEYKVTHTKTQMMSVVQELRIEGFHGCPFFNTALNAAKVLLDAKAVVKVTVVRAGTAHVPKWSAPYDKVAWNKLKQETFDSGSPRVIEDGNTAGWLDSSAFVVKYASTIQKFAADNEDEMLLGLPEGMAAHPELWKRVNKTGAGAIWQLTAGSIYYAAFTLYDPPGAFLTDGFKSEHGLHYEDKGCEAGTFLPHDTFDEICGTQPEN